MKDKRPTHLYPSLRKMDLYPCLFRANQRSTQLLFKTAQQKFRMFKAVLHRAYHLNSSFAVFLSPWHGAIIAHLRTDVNIPVV